MPPSDDRVDALLVLSFGGPEGLADVRPFLENVVRGRGVPPERLDAVEEHYRHFGGVSPLNARNRELIAALRQRTDLPVYFGNRNWHPMVEDTVAAMARDGVRRALVFATSAYGGYSACRQYHEDIARARAAVGDERRPELVKLRHFFDHPAFVAANADAVRAARDTLPAELRDAARVVFTAHSVPAAADAAAGTRGRRRAPLLPPGRRGGPAGGAARAGARRRYDVVWQSRSGPPQVPWLEPDVVDHLDALAADGVPAVVVVPVGFVSDHVEVIWDLDTEARERAGELGLAFARAATAGPDPRFADMVVELVAEHVHGAAPRALSADVPVGRMHRQRAAVRGRLLRARPAAVGRCVRSDRDRVAGRPG